MQQAKCRMRPTTPTYAVRAAQQANSGASGHTRAARSYTGNQALLRRAPATVPFLQCKLQIGAVNDPLEAEADSVAERVMRMPEPASVSTSGVPSLRRKCAACEEEDKALRTKSMGQTPSGTVAPPIVHQVLSSPGRPLDPATRAFFEPRFGADFSGIRLHSDSLAAQSAAAVNARAFTVGNQVVLGAGAGAGPTPLLAHELTHVLQQGAVPESSYKGSATQRSQVQRQTAGDEDTGKQQAPSSAVASDESQNPESQIEYTTQGPTAAGGGTGAAAASSGSPEITLETGNVGAGFINNKVHQQVCVDTSGDGNKACFSFAATGVQAPEFSSTWLGWSSNVIGAVIQGEVYDPKPVPGATIESRLSPTAAQASRWYTYMLSKRLGLQDGYSVARHNCRLFSQWEFRDAPSNW